MPQAALRTFTSFPLREGGWVRFCALFVLFLCAGGAPAQQPSYRIETIDRQQVNATITYEIRTTQFAANRWMVFLPEPPELPSQTKVKVTATPGGKLVAEKSLLAREVRYLELAVARPAPGAGLSLKLDVEATLRSRKLVELQEGEKPPVIPPLNANERKYYLSATTHVDFDAKAFQGWLDDKKLRRGKSEDLIDFAARVLEVIRTDYRYYFDPDEDKRASVVCKGAKTDCGGMSYLFVGAMRANNIPARLLVGRQALPRKPGSTPSQTEYDRPHIRVEMFVPGIGWVPLDPANAQADRRKPVRTHIGHDPGDLLVLHVDVDLKLPFSDRMREAQFLQINPFYWTTGTGTFDGTFGPSGWEVKVTPVAKK